MMKPAPPNLPLVHSLFAANHGPSLTSIYSSPVRPVSLTAQISQLLLSVQSIIQTASLLISTFLHSSTQLREFSYMLPYCSLLLCLFLYSLFPQHHYFFLPYPSLSPLDRSISKNTLMYSSHSLSFAFILITIHLSYSLLNSTIIGIII